MRERNPWKAVHPHGPMCRQLTCNVGSSLDLLVACHDSNVSAGSSVDTLDMGHDKDCFRSEGSEECIFNISGNFERYTVCMGQGVPGKAQGSSIEVEGSCSVLYDRGGVSFLGKSMLCSIVVDKCFDIPQSHDTIMAGEESCILDAVTEVLSWDSMSGEASVRGQFTTASEPRIFHH